MKKLLLIPILLISLNSFCQFSKNKSELGFLSFGFSSGQGVAKITIPSSTCIGSSAQFIAENVASYDSIEWVVYDLDTVLSTGTLSDPYNDTTNYTFSAADIASGGVLVWLRRYTFKDHTIDIPSTGLEFYWTEQADINSTDSTLWNIITNKYDPNVKLLGSLSANGSISAKSKNKLLFYGDTVPVSSLFQNYNYADTMFFKKEQHTLNSDSVELLSYRLTKIAKYSTPKTGSELASLNTEFDVPDYASDGVRVVGVGETYSTIEQAIVASSTGDTIYVKSGIYDEEHNGTLRYLWIDKAVSIIGVGDVKVTSPATNIVCYFVSNNSLVENIEFDGEGNTSSVLVTYSVGAKIIGVKNCYVSGAVQYLVNGNDVGSMSIENSVFDGNENESVQYLTFHGTHMKENYLEDVATYIRTDADYKWNHYEKNGFSHCLLLESENLNCNYNTFNYDLIALNVQNTAVSDLTLNVKRNIFNQGDASTTIVAAINVPANPVYDINISHNTFTDTISSHSATNTYFVQLVDQENAEIDSNTFSSITTGSLIQLYVNGTTNMSGTKIRNNSFTSNSLSSYIVTINGESTTGNLADNCMFTGNKIIGHRLSYPLTPGATTHALLINSGVNNDISNNYIGYTSLGIVVKSGQEEGYDSLGVFSNLFVDNKVALWVRGVDTMPIYNNTFYHSDDSYATGFERFIIVDENAPAPGNFSKAPMIRNNLFNAEVLTGVLISLDDTASNNAVTDYNLLFGGQHLIYDGVTNFSSLATAQSSGFLLNSYDTDPQLTNYIPSSVSDANGNGVELSVNYNSVLLDGSVWPNAILTGTQNTNWDIGAFKIE